MSCHSASVRSEVYRIRSVLRECIYIVQTKIADFIDAFWVFKQALRRNIVYSRQGSATVELNPGEIAQSIANQEAIKPRLEIIIQPRIIAQRDFKQLEPYIWIVNLGTATADDVIVILHQQPVGGFSVNSQACNQTNTSHPGNALKLINPLNPGKQVGLCSIDMGQVAPPLAEFGSRVLARNQPARDVS